MPGKARGGRLVGAIAVAILLAGASAVLAVGDELSRKDPQAALRLGFRTPAALAAAADKGLAGNDLSARTPGVEADAAAALAANPLDVRAVRTLALSAQDSGDTDRAEALFHLADARSRRDPMTEFWLFQDDALSGRFDSAARHADAAMRFEWRLGRVLFPALTAVLANPASARPIAERLAGNPDWRRPFLPYLADHADDPNAAGRLFVALAATRAPPSDAESGAIVERVASTGDFAAARALWLRLLPKGTPASGSGVYNGDFAALPGAPPFNWLYPAENGAVAEPGPATDGKPALYVRSPADAQHLLAVQLLMLPPGGWRLTGLVRVEPGEAGPVFAWRVGCLNAADIAEARVPAEPPGWRGFSADFQVPPGCPAQRLQLFGLPHAGFEPAEAYWRGVAIQPAPKGPGVAAASGNRPA